MKNKSFKLLCEFYWCLGKKILMEFYWEKIIAPIRKPFYKKNLKIFKFISKVFNTPKVWKKIKDNRCRLHELSEEIVILSNQFIKK